MTPHTLTLITRLTELANDPALSEYQRTTARLARAEIELLAGREESREKALVEKWRMGAAG